MICALKTCPRALSVCIEIMITAYNLNHKVDDYNLQLKTYLLYSGVTTDQLFPQVSDVVVVFLHILLEVVPSERQQWLLHLALKL